MKNADDLLTQFRALRDSATKDALFAINYGRTTLNDWAAIDAGVSVGQFPIWTQQISAIPGAVSRGAAAFWSSLRFRTISAGTHN